MLQKYKNIGFSLIVTFTFISIQFISIGQVKAVAPLCKVNDSPAPCVSQPGDPTFEDDKCYRAAANSQQRDNYREVECDDTFAGGSSLEHNSETIDCEEDELNPENCKLLEWVVNIINVLSALAIIVIAGSIMYAGFLYMTAGSDGGQVKQVVKAKNRIIWSIVALLLFIFGYAFLNWVVPGGLL